MMIVLLIFVGVNLFLWGWVWVVPVLVVFVNWLPGIAKGAAPFPGIVVIKRVDEDKSQTLLHEFKHQDQMKKYSPLVVAVFLGWYYGKGLLLGKKIGELYDANPLEVEAYSSMYKGKKLPKYIKVNSEK